MGGHMYHISDDRRSRRSAERIYDGLIACLGLESFDRVTVSEVQRHSGVARTTFYRCFDNLSDVLAWRCDEGFRAALGGLEPREFRNERGLLRTYFSYWMENGEILELLVRNNRADIVYASHRRVGEELRERFGTLPRTEGDRGDFFMAVRTGFTLSILLTWAGHGRRESIDQLMGIIDEQAETLARGIRGDGAA
jgi:AcrR family transcriptional regulator